MESYIRRLFGNANLRIVPRPKKKDSADVYAGEESIGALLVDDEDGERSYNFEMPISAADVQDHRLVALVVGQVVDPAALADEGLPNVDALHAIAPTDHAPHAARRG